VTVTTAILAQNREVEIITLATLKTTMKTFL